MSRTDVFIVLDQSASMTPDKTATAMKMVYEMAEVLARAEKVAWDQKYSITIIPFATHVSPMYRVAPQDLINRWMAIRTEFAQRSVGQMTALRDAIGVALERVQASTAEAQLVSVFTDGGENSSILWSTARLSALVAKLEATGKLTLTLAGPKQARDHLSAIGIPVANFRAWDGTEDELQQTARATTAALNTYTAQRAAGVTSTGKFYADLTQVTPAGIRANTKQVQPAQVRTVTRYMAGRAIADFYGRDFKPGTHYYQLIKPEYLQDDKDLVILIKDKGEYRQGSRAVRTLLGLPEVGKVRINPGPHTDKYEIYVQSSSVNRKVVEGQQMLTL
jgi:hypothetical protein